MQIGFALILIIPAPPPPRRIPASATACLLLYPLDLLCPQTSALSWDFDNLIITHNSRVALIEWYRHYITYLWYM